MIKCLPLFISSIQTCNGCNSTQAQNKIDEERLQMEKEKNSTATSLKYN